MFKMVLALITTTFLLADGPVVKTGQTAIYKIGDDGTYQTGLTRSYSRNAAGVVSDNTTNLQWQDDAIGSEMNWADAQTYCSNLLLDGKSDWRLPAIEELVSITDKGRHNPSIDPVFMKVTTSSYWSWTPVASFTDDAWTVSFYSGGDDNFYAKTARLYVRCVRDEQ